MTELDDQLAEESKRFKLDLLKAARAGIQAAIAFGVAAATVYYTGAHDKASAITAGVLAALGYSAGNLQTTGGVRLTLDGLKK